MSSSRLSILICASFLSTSAYASQAFVKKERGEIFGKIFKKDKIRPYKYKRFGRVEFKDGDCQTLTYGWKVYPDESVSISMPEEACLALNPVEETYPNERVLSDSFAFSSELIFDEDMASDEEKSKYDAYRSDLEKLFILEVKVNRMIPRLSKKKVSLLRKARIKARLLRFLGSKQYEERTGLRSLIPVKGEISTIKNRVIALKTEIAHLMKEEGPQDCGAMSHGSIISKNYYPLSVYSPSSCALEAVEATLTCNDGLITNSLEDLSSYTDQLDACSLVVVSPSVEFASNLPASLNVASESLIDVTAQASLDSREIVEIDWYIDGRLSDQHGSSLSILPEVVGQINVRVVVKDSSGLEAESNMDFEVVPVKVRDFTNDYTAFLEAVEGEGNQLILSFSLDGQARNSLYREFKKGGERPGIPIEYDYANRKYAVEFNDASGTVWMLQIDSINAGYRFVDGNPDFYNIIISPSNAIIYRDGVIVEGLDAFTNGLSQVNDAAIYQVEL